MPRYVEKYFLNASREVGLKVEPRADGLTVVRHAQEIAIRAERE